MVVEGPHPHVHSAALAANGRWHRGQRNDIQIPHNELKSHQIPQSKVHTINPIIRRYQNPVNAWNVS